MIDVLGLRVPDAGMLFLAVLVVHIAAGLTSVAAGLLAASAHKGPGRHPRAGRVYLWALGFVFGTATMLAAIRWPHDMHLFAIAVVAFGLGLYGWRFRPNSRPGHEARHAIGMGGSFIALFTGFYVDNGPQLPLWRQLPHWMYWVLPTAVGAPLMWMALRRYHKADARYRRECSAG